MCFGSLSLISLNDRNARCWVQTLHSLGRSWELWVPSGLYIAVLGIGFSWDWHVSLPFPPILVWVLSSFCVMCESHSASFWIPFREIVPCVAVDLVNPWEKVSSEIFYMAIFKFWNFFLKNIFWIQVLIEYVIDKYFLPICGLSFVDLKFFILKMFNLSFLLLWTMLLVLYPKNLCSM